MVKHWQPRNAAWILLRKIHYKRKLPRDKNRKQKIKTREGPEDLKTSRCTSWRGGLAGEQGTAEHLNDVGPIRCALKENTTAAHWGHEHPKTGLAADFTHDFCPREFPANSLCKTSGLFALLDKYGPTSCTCSPDNTLQKEHFSWVFDRPQKRNSRWLTQLSAFSNCRWNPWVRRISSC